MKEIKPIASANPFNVVRSIPTFQIPPNKIIVRDDVENDPIFTSRYVAFLSGKTNVHYTRMSISRIRRGFWRSAKSEFELIEETIRNNDVDSIKDLITSGIRLSLHIYENPNKNDDFSYVCADDTPIHVAYEELGISVVPVVLMGKPRDLEESAITIRSIPRGDKDYISLIEGATPVRLNGFHNFLKSEEISLSDALSKLEIEVEKTKNDLRVFHKPARDANHYHHSLHSVLVRAKEHVESIRLLVDNGKLMVATSLLRPLHELALTFYIDWLMPMHMYQYLQLASVMSSDKWDVECEKRRKRNVSEGVLKADANRIKIAHLKAFRFCSVVAEKARIFPLGEEYHKSIYSFLSDMVHHDFSMTARYIDTLDHGDNMVFNENVEHTIRHVAHATISCILSRIRSDIGSAAGA
ncbi:hypothetical protein PQR72_01305 [Paraburkholderia madseniana]|uniref:hypothetical protein n=1 Tax=Paraburkholderia madseniana TaxID=2599607 RepID=UPI0015C535EF|nr:hypothetical protein [Paraburkholderia madseniana]NPT64630.1 hypothetical protein [Paraburkholderia madseniana]